MKRDTYTTGCDEMRERFKIYTDSSYVASDAGELEIPVPPAPRVAETTLAGYKRMSNADDKPPLQGHTQAMSDISREEFNAKLETIEARMDARVESVSSKIDAFLATQAAVQVERDKAQAERDKRFEALAEKATKAAEGAEAAANQAVTVKNNYWAAVGVQLLAVAAILVGAYYANQGNTLMVAQTTLAAFSSGKDAAQGTEEKARPSPTPTNQQSK